MYLAVVERPNESAHLDSTYRTRSPVTSLHCDYRQYNTVNQHG